MKTLLLLIAMLLFSSCESDRQVTLTGRTMGTTYHIIYIEPAGFHLSSVNIQTRIDSILDVMSNHMSTWEQDSEISRFNRSTDTSFVKVSNDFFYVLKTAKQIWRLSDGAFDVTVSPLINAWGFGQKRRPNELLSKQTVDSLMQFIGTEKLLLRNGEVKKTHPQVTIETAAIAKGHGVDLVANMFDQLNLVNYKVEIGGELVTRGLKIDGSRWKIGIEKPSIDVSVARKIEQILDISDKAIATSGDYRNFYVQDGKRIQHIIDPKTGFPVSHALASVTIIANDCTTADAFATAVLVMGIEDGLKLINSIVGIEGYLIERRANDELVEYYSDNFKDYLAK